MGTFGFIALVLVVTGTALIKTGTPLGGAFLLAGLIVPAIPQIGDWYASKRDKDN